MTRLVPSRIDITLTLIELDDDGMPVNEYPQQPHTVYGYAGVARWLTELAERITDAEQQLTKGGDANGHHSELRASLPGRD